MHKCVLSVLQLRVLGPPERIYDLDNRATSLLLGSSRVLVSERLCGFKMTDGRCSMTQDVPYDALVLHVTSVAGL
jgi:hypothetical protein